MALLLHCLTKERYLAANSLHHRSRFVSHSRVQTRSMSLHLTDGIHEVLFLIEYEIDFVMEIAVCLLCKHLIGRLEKFYCANDVYP